MQFDRFNCDDVFKIYLNLLYLQLKNTLLTFHIFIFIKENRKKSNWIVVSKMGFPQDYKTRLYVFTTVNLLYLHFLKKNKKIYIHFMIINIYFIKDTTLQHHYKNKKFILLLSNNNNNNKNKKCLQLSILV